MLCWRLESIASASSEIVTCRWSAISLNAFQNASSRLTLVLWPAMTMDFALASNDVVAGLAPGAKVRFEFRAGEPGEFVVTRIEQAGGKPKPATPPAHGGH